MKTVHVARTLKAIGHIASYVARTQSTGIGLHSWLRFVSIQRIYRWRDWRGQAGTET